MNIVFLDEYAIDTSDLSSIKSLGNYTGYDLTPDSKVIERCAEADVVIANKTPLKEHTLRALPKLKLICIAATGMNNVDLNAARELGITVKNAVDYSTHSVAESTLGFVLALYKQTVYYDHFVKSGRYAAADRQFDFGRTIHELHGKRWGIIGLGNIGRRVAQLAEAFGCTVGYYSTSGTNQNAVYERQSLEELLSQSDIVSIHAPLNRTTYHLIDIPQFEQMKSTAIIINVARGSIISEQALATALNNGTIAAAALDVFSSEPMLPDNPLLTIDDPYKLIMSPHTAWASVEALQLLVEKIAENIRLTFGIK